MKFHHKEKTNVITCKGVKGIFKNHNIKLKIGNSAEDSILYVSGVKVKYTGIWIKILPTKPTTVTIEMLKRD